MLKWLLALAIAVFRTLALYIVAKILARSFRALAKIIPADLAEVLADSVSRTKLIILEIISIYAGSRVLVLPATLANLSGQVSTPLHITAMPFDKHLSELSR